jgi:hypothetical protein
MEAIVQPQASSVSSVGKSTLSKYEYEIKPGRHVQEIID